MIIVTGGAGFIGSNLVHALNARGVNDIVVVDDLSDGRKFQNIAGANVYDYLDVEEFRRLFLAGPLPWGKLERIYHLGACSTTTEWNGRMMMDLNYAYTRDLINFCIKQAIPIVYASSAAIYGGASAFVESNENARPLNVYAYSKHLLDAYVERLLPNIKSQIVGLRYFNVYGPREQHKASMASIAFHLNQQLLDSGEIKLFQGSGGFGDGEQLRDFVHVDDAVATTLWFATRNDVSGVFNCGTGRAQSFNEIAQAVLRWHGQGKLSYIPFPDNLKGAYQSFTEADLTRLRGVGCDISFRDVAQGVKDYLDWLNDCD